jgi:hypothetical protein
MMFGFGLSPPVLAIRHIAEVFIMWGSPKLDKRTKNGMNIGLGDMAA